MKTIQVIKLQIDLLALDIENLENDAKIEALEEIEKSITTLKQQRVPLLHSFQMIVLAFYNQSINRFTVQKIRYKIKKYLK